ncbi:MAG: SOS response-associated peptidase family protein [Planctomycetes bacterium]|nr:SOS response-associated peptidase family protein [Planctomycetota bacterium]
MKPLHERMPVILEASQIATWLDLSSPPAEIKAMLVPGPAALTEFACQAPRNDQPPRPEQPSLF